MYLRALNRYNVIKVSIIKEMYLPKPTTKYTTLTHSKLTEKNKTCRKSTK